MASPPRIKPELAQGLMQAGGNVGTAAVMFHEAVADRLGINPTDQKCLHLLHSRENATAGDLAEWTGLTTGAATGIIDRLEKAGFVRREPHPTDRRKVVIRAVSERLPEIQQLFAAVGAGIGELCSKYTADELRVIQDYMNGTAEVFRRETRRLRDQDVP